MWDFNDAKWNFVEDCARLEFLINNPDPNAELPEWVHIFFREANELHKEAIKTLLGDTSKHQRNNFPFWWSLYRKRLQELRDEKELKKSLDLEDEKAKMGRWWIQKIPIFK